MRVIMAIAIILSALAPLMVAPQPAQAAECQFVLGFKALHDLIPDVVGNCKTNEYHNAQNGDGLQETTAWHGKGGLLVWRKADNWTAFTDGANTWINGPNGLQKRANTECFDWEKACVRPGDKYQWHDDEWGKFRYPVGYERMNVPVGADGNWVLYHTKVSDTSGPVVMVGVLTPPMDTSGLTPTQITAIMAAVLNEKTVTLRTESATINGRTASLLWLESTGQPRMRFVLAAIQVGSRAHIMMGAAPAQDWERSEPIILDSMRSYIAKK